MYTVPVVRSPTCTSHVVVGLLGVYTWNIYIDAFVSAAFVYRLMLNDITLFLFS